jgi:hypothetical protein
MSYSSKKALISKGISGVVCNICDRMISQIDCERIMSLVNMPNVGVVDEVRTDFGLPLKDVTNTLKNISERADNKFLLGDRGKELLDKVSQYRIPIDKNNLNWFDLIDEVADYELLLEEAYRAGVDWDISEYDPVALQQEIEYYERREREAQQDLYRSFYSQPCLGV